MAINPYEKYLGPEDKLQRQVMQYIGMQYPKAIITHPANEGKRSKFEQYKLKTLGVTAGIPDLLIFTPNKKYNGLAIELKSGYNKPRPTQKQWLEDLKTCNWFTIWLNNFDDCKLVIDSYFNNALD